MWPVKLNLGQIKGTGCFRILVALTVLVCHAENSKVLVVCFIVEGAVCCRSLNLAEHPTWKRTRPRINESSSLGNGPPPPCGLSAPGWRGCFSFGVQTSGEYISTMFGCI